MKNTFLYFVISLLLISCGDDQHRSKIKKKINLNKVMNEVNYILSEDTVKAVLLSYIKRNPPEGHTVYHIDVDNTADDIVIKISSMIYATSLEESNFCKIDKLFENYFIITSNECQNTGQDDANYKKVYGILVDDSKNKNDDIKTGEHVIEERVFYNPEITQVYYSKRRRAFHVYENI
ncbi:hypothetical protein PK28_13645 [Hymenobacter sp. DG25B]|uniref:hypothetical protein n=1 Tax=Hymenobacter sp. DG25B TaxID=1385664 RepID=UPI000540AD4B|nr:hypothetical protein [Hymenobacter sp. DG25B]AIZ64455.1 hypothetical protein PK28_13645 [Hymenobacter sp. DG25B]